MCHWRDSENGLGARSAEADAASQTNTPSTVVAVVAVLSLLLQSVAGQVAKEPKHVSPIGRATGAMQDRTQKTKPPPTLVKPSLTSSLSTANIAEEEGIDGSDNDAAVDDCSCDDDGGGLALWDGCSNDGDAPE